MGAILVCTPGYSQNQQNSPFMTVIYLFVYLYLCLFFFSCPAIVFSTSMFAFVLLYSFSSPLLQYITQTIDADILKMKSGKFDDLKTQFVPHRETNSVYITKIYHIIFLRKMSNGCYVVRMIQNIFFFETYFRHCA